MSNQAHPVEELEGSVDPRSIKYEHSKHSIKNGVFVDVIFSAVVVIVVKVVVVDGVVPKLHSFSQYIEHEPP